MSGKRKYYISFLNMSYQDYFAMRRKGKRSTAHVLMMQKVLYWFAVSLLIVVLAMFVAFIYLLF